jgi:hypothetical protein
MARKCGNCHAKRMPKSAHASTPASPVAAVHPIRGGIAPGNAPTTVESELRVFSGV